MLRTHFVQLVVLLATLLGASYVHAQNSPKYSNEFLRIGVGANAIGMGNARTALVNDVTAGYWNPAALTRIEKNYEVGLMHAEYFAGIAKYDYAGFTLPLQGERRLALSFIRLGVDDIPNTLDFRDGNSFNYARITSFSVADVAVLLSYAQPLGQSKWSAGGNFKIINRTIGPFATAWGFGLDAAVAYTGQRLKLGFVLSDVTSTFNLWSYNTETFEDAFVATGNELPENSTELTLPSARTSVGYTFSFGTQQNFGLATALDVEWTFDGPRNTALTLGRISLDPRLGLEAHYKQRVFLRLGVMNVQQVQRIDGQEVLDAFPTAGVGLRLPLPGVNVQLDYALSNLSGFSQNLYSHLISLRFAFDEIKL